MRNVADPPDLEAYVLSADGRAAESWQLERLRAMRRKLSAGLDVQAYAELRSAMARHVASFERVASRIG